MRRALPAVVIALVLGLLLAVVRVRTDPTGAKGVAPIAPGPGAETPVARLRRGAPPVVTRAPADDPEPSRPQAASTRATVDVPPRQMTLDDLAPDVRAAVGKDALAHLHELVDACERRAPGREDLGAFLVLDHDGILELDLRPIAQAAGPIQVEDRELPTALVDCLDDALWEQDWSAVGAAIPEGAELPAALTMRLGEREAPPG